MPTEHGPDADDNERKVGLEKRRRREENEGGGRRRCMRGSVGQMVAKNNCAIEAALRFFKCILQFESEAMNCDRGHCSQCLMMSGQERAE